MSSMDLLKSVIILFMIMVLGFALRRRNVMTEDLTKGLTDLLLRITLPLSIIVSFQYDFSVDRLMKASSILLISILLYTSLIFVSKVIYIRYPEKKQALLRLGTMFSNAFFMGYPVITSIYGQEGVFYLTVFNLPYNFMLWSIGLIIFTGEKDWKGFRKALVNPVLISAFIGLCLFLFSIKIPELLKMPMSMLGSVTTPLSMLIIGATLANNKIKEAASNLTVWYASFNRLIVIPIIVLIILKLLGVKGMLLGIPVIIAAMPICATSGLLATRYNIEPELASQGIFFSTLLSIFTVPMIALLL